MAPVMDPYFSKVIPSLKNAGWVWELVAEMLQPDKSIRNQKMQICLRP